VYIAIALIETPIEYCESMFDINFLQPITRYLLQTRKP